MDVFNVTEISHKWDEKKATAAFEAFRKRNGFTDKELKFETRTIGDEVMKPEVVHKFHKMDAYPASLHHVWVLLAPSKTFICSATNFEEFDGTSCFNLVKGFVHTYYENGKAPLVRPMAGNKELDLQLDASDPELCAKLSAWVALKVAVMTSVRFAVAYGRWLISREVFDMLATASPTNVVAIETFDMEENEEMVKAIKERKGKMFAHIMACSAQSVRIAKHKEPANPVLITQVSTQSRYYKPSVPRNVCGNWLIGLGAKTTLDELSDETWSLDYYHRMIEHIETFSGVAAWNFINQALFGFLGTGAWANPRAIYWFNNYGPRDMHPKAGGVTYHWGPNYGVSTYLLVNVLMVDGRTCITYMSSVIPQGELLVAVKELKRLLIETAAKPRAKAPDASRKKSPAKSPKRNGSPANGKKIKAK